ncbi:MAG TPA: hypothetical protein VG867_11245 [Rhizomicrobium sp.]|nr:hypothetical protein [Rhizomicrobium sp.]
MKYPIVISALTLLLSAHAASAADASHWYDAVTGTKLSSLEGSTAQLSLGESGLDLNVTAPDGGTTDKLFQYMSDDLGAVYDAADKTAPIGVFRQSDKGIDAEYADGHTETISANSGGGLTIALHAPDSGLMCMKWYPQGHVFDESERKQALAAYANKLGLSSDEKMKAPVATSCADTPARTASVQKPVAKTAPVKLAMTAPKTILVKASDIHTIDPMPASAVAAPAIADAHLVKASAEVPANHGASNCLSIDSDGQNWGFRNACDNSVQFAYCLQNGKDRETACGTGTAEGGVARHGFFALIASSAVIDDNHQFRWVACAGDAGTVTPHLDRTDPPAGRCVRAQNS